MNSCVLHIFFHSLFHSMRCVLDRTFCGRKNCLQNLNEEKKIVETYRIDMHNFDALK